MPVPVPDRTAGSLGTTKSDASPLTNEPQQVSAAQYNQCADSLIAAINLANSNEAAIGTVSYVPLTGSEPGAVLAILCDGNMTDLAGDADFSVTGSDFETGASYDGLRDAIKLSTPVLRTTSGTDHQVPIASPITYGGMFYLEYSQSATPFLLASTSGVLASEQNYGFRFNPGSGASVFQPVPAGQSFANAEVPRWAWTHVMVTENAGRTSQSLYINGSLRDTLVSANIGVAAAADDFNLGSNNGVANTGAAGLATDIFVSDEEYTAAQVRTLAENAFGHPLP